MATPIEMDLKIGGNLDFTVKLGARQGVMIIPKNSNSKTGTYVTGAIKQALTKLIEAAATEGKTEVSIDKSFLGKGANLASAAGNYFEYCVYSGLIAAVSEKGAQVTDEGQNRKSVYAAILGTGPAGEQLKRMCEEAGKSLGPILAEGLGLTEEDLQKDFEVHWLGGSGSVGDIQVKAKGITIMIECKNYGANTISQYGVSYFTLSDAVGNFNPPFSKYLYPDQRSKPGDLSTDDWLHYVLGDWYLEWVKQFSGSSEPKAILSYLLSKGEKASQDGAVKQRALVVLEKVNVSKGFANIHVGFNLDQLIQEINEDDISLQARQGEILFEAEMLEKGRQQIADLSIVNQEEIRRNSRYEHPQDDGTGWKTVLHMELTRAFIDMMASQMEPKQLR